jgi:hypothetical protein
MCLSQPCPNTTHSELCDTPSLLNLVLISQCPSHIGLGGDAHRKKAQYVSSMRMHQSCYPIYGVDIYYFVDEKMKSER